MTDIENTSDREEQSSSSVSQRESQEPQRDKEEVQPASIDLAALIESETLREKMILAQGAAQAAREGTGLCHMEEMEDVTQEESPEATPASLVASEYVYAQSERIPSEDTHPGYKLKLGRNRYASNSDVAQMEVVLIYEGRSLAIRPVRENDGNLKEDKVEMPPTELIAFAGIDKETGHRTGDLYRVIDGETVRVEPSEKDQMSLYALRIKREHERRMAKSDESTSQGFIPTPRGH